MTTKNSKASGNDSMEIEIAPGDDNTYVTSQKYLYTAKRGRLNPGMTPLASMVASEMPPHPDSNEPIKLQTLAAAPGATHRQKDLPPTSRATFVSGRSHLVPISDMPMFLALNPLVLAATAQPEYVDLMSGVIRGLLGISSAGRGVRRDVVKLNTRVISRMISEVIQSAGTLPNLSNSQVAKMSISDDRLEEALTEDKGRSLSDAAWVQALLFGSWHILSSYFDSADDVTLGKLKCTVSMEPSLVDLGHLWIAEVWLKSKQLTADWQARIQDRTKRIMLSNNIGLSVMESEVDDFVSTMRTIVHTSTSSLVVVHQTLAMSKLRLLGDEVSASWMNFAGVDANLDDLAVQNMILKSRGSSIAVSDLSYMSAAAELTNLLKMPLFEVMEVGNVSSIFAAYVALERPSKEISSLITLSRYLAAPAATAVVDTRVSLKVAGDSHIIQLTTPWNDLSAIGSMSQASVSEEAWAKFTAWRATSQAYINANLVESGKPSQPQITRESSYISELLASVGLRRTVFLPGISEKNTLRAVASNAVKFSVNHSAEGTDLSNEPFVLYRVDTTRQIWHQTGAVSLTNVAYTNHMLTALICENAREIESIRECQPPAAAVGVKLTPTEVVMNELLLTARLPGTASSPSGFGTSIFELRDTSDFVPAIFTIPVGLLVPGTRDDNWVEFTIRADMLFADGLIDPQIVVPFAVLSEQARITRALASMSSVYQSLRAQGGFSSSTATALMLEAMNLFAESLMKGQTLSTASAINAIAIQMLSGARVRVLKKVLKVGEKGDGDENTLSTEQSAVIHEMRDQSKEFDTSVVDWLSINDRKGQPSYFVAGTSKFNHMPFQHISEPILAAAKVVAISVLSDFITKEKSKSTRRALPSVLLRSFGTMRR